VTAAVGVHDQDLAGGNRGRRHRGGRARRDALRSESESESESERKMFRTRDSADAVREPDRNRNERGEGCREKREWAWSA
jgi:hypothetical protein